MKPETAKQFESILDARAVEKQKDVDRATQARNREAQNLLDFEDVKEKVIKPAFEEIVSLYQSKGITLRVKEEKESQISPRGGISPAKIELDMTGVHGQSDLHPHFSLSFHKQGRNLSLHTATQNQAGPAGQISLDQITSDWIFDAFLKYESGKH